MDPMSLVRIVRISPKCRGNNPCESDYCFYWENGRRASMRINCNEPWALRLQNPNVKLCEKTFRHSKSVYDGLYKEKKVVEKIEKNIVDEKEKKEEESITDQIFSDKYSDDERKDVMNKLLDYFGIVLEYDESEEEENEIESENEEEENDDIEIVKNTKNRYRPFG